MRSRFVEKNAADSNNIARVSSDDNMPGPTGSDTQHVGWHGIDVDGGRGGRCHVGLESAPPVYETLDDPCAALDASDDTTWLAPKQSHVYAHIVHRHLMDIDIRPGDIRRHAP